MTLSTRFPAALHILTVLAIKTDGFIGSEMIAKSLGTNAVVVRRILGQLQQAGFVVTQSGSQGGAQLNVDPAKISLLDVYNAVEGQSVFKMHDPHAECPVACSVKIDVDQLLECAEGKMKAELEKTKLSKVTKPAIEAYKDWSKEE